MAYLMKVCELHERNTGSGDEYRYITGWMDPTTRVVIMPNRDKQEAGDADWIMYLSPVRSREDEEIAAELAAEAGSKSRSQDAEG